MWAAAVLTVLLSWQRGWVRLPPSTPIARQWTALTGVTIINPGRDRREDQTLTIGDGRIEAIRDRVPDSELLPRARAFEGRYILPGLIDLDVRRVPADGELRRLFGVLFLATGVTTIRDIGNFQGSIVELQRRIAAGEEVWPRLVACGRVLDGDPPLCPGNRIVRSADDAARAVADVAASGASCVAVQSHLGGDPLATIRLRAASQDLPLIGDVPVGVPPDTADLAEVHLVTALPLAQPSRGPSDRIRAWALFDARRGVDAFVDAAAQERSAYIPNLLLWKQLTSNQDVVMWRTAAPFMPRYYAEVLWPQSLAAMAGVDAETYAAAIANLQRATQRLHAAGVPLHIGSGTPGAFVEPGYGMLFELMQLVAAGIPPEDVWAAATRVAGEALGIPQLGVLEAGAPADLLIFGKDPTLDMRNLNSLQAVIAQGRLYGKPLLDRYVDQHARYVRSIAYDRLSMLVPHLAMRWAGEESGECASP